MQLNFDHSRPQDVRLSLEQSLRRLNTDYIDVLQQHWPSPDIPLVDTIGELERLKKEGKIRAIGVSNWMEPEWEGVG
ncbi:MAG: aldo/keto reductase [Candidatus Binatia bacterium]